MNNNNQQTAELKGNLFSIKSNGYYGIMREWCVAKITGDTMLGTTERVDTYSKEAFSFDLDFGKPRQESIQRSQEHIGINRFDFQEAISNLLDDVMESGSRNVIADECVERFKKEYELKVKYTSYEKGGDWVSRVSGSLQKKETETQVATAKDIKPYLSENEFDVKVYWSGMAFFTVQKSYYGENAIKYLVNKLLKEKYTYCTKMGKNIVPDEYIKLGKEGIERWRQEKSNKNKNNSIEKQTIRKIKTEKKNNAFIYFNDVIREMLNENGKHEWDKVFLSVDGRWNTGRRLNTVKKNILNMTDDELITVSDEEIKNRCKEYWKKELKEAIRRIEELDFNNNNN